MSNVKFDVWLFIFVLLAYPLANAFWKWVAGGLAGMGGSTAAQAGAGLGGIV